VYRSNEIKEFFALPKKLKEFFLVISILEGVKTTKSKEKLPK